MQQQLSALLEVVRQVAQTAMVDLSVFGTERLFRVQNLKPGERASLGWLINQVKRADHIVIVPDVRTLPRITTFLSQETTSTTTAILHFYGGFPVKDQKHLLGVLSVMARSEHRLTTDQQRAIATLADQIGYLLGAKHHQIVNSLAKPELPSPPSASPPAQVTSSWASSGNAAMLKLSMALQKCLSLEDFNNQLIAILPQEFPITAFELVLNQGAHTAQILCRWSALKATQSTNAVQGHSPENLTPCLLSSSPDSPKLLRVKSSFDQNTGSSQGKNQICHWDCYPLKIKRRTVGVLKIQWVSEVKARISSDDTTFHDLAEQISITIHRLHLFQKLQSQSLQDPLTKLFNRRYMMSVLTKLLKRVSYGHYQVGLIMMDIDHFKQLNDTFGHDAGDQVLRVIGLFFKGHARPNDVMCRYGGEEFALILPDVTWEILERRANQLCRGVKYLSLNFHQTSLEVTLSAGYALAPMHGTTPATLIKAADMALYAAKREGRDRAVGAPLTESSLSKKE